VSEPARIGLRLFGLLCLVFGVGMLVLLVVPGPGEVAEWMGQSCRRSKSGPSETCTVGDVIELALAAPAAILLGFPLVLALRPRDKGPFTLDLSRLNRRR
jgi:hypothetical protein